MTMRSDRATRIAMRCCTLFAALASLGGRVSANEPADAPTAGRFFQTHCVECHGADAQEGGLRLDSLAVDFSAPASFARWVKIHDRLKKGEMPPKDSPQPAAGERKEFVDWLAARLIAADASLRHADGRAVVRRLNRSEYEHTLCDLLDLPELPVRDLLPEDGRAYGYDKAGEALELSHVQIAKYMEVADLALDAATAQQIERPEVVKRRVYPTQRNGYKGALGNGDAVLLKDFKVDTSILAPPGKKKPPEVWKQELKDAQKALESFQGSVGIFRQEGLDFIPNFPEFVADYAGMYRVRISFWSFTWDKGEILPATKQHTVQLRAGPRGRERFLGYYDIDSLKSTIVETTVWLHPGDKIGFSGTTLLPLALTGPEGRGKWVGQGVASDWMDIEGPLYDNWPSQSHQRLFAGLPLRELEKGSPLRFPDHSLPAVLGQLRPGAMTKAKKHPWAVFSDDPKADAERLLSGFLPRAFRRPITDRELAKYTAMVEQLVGEKLTFEDSLRWAYKTALCSADFLYLADPPGKLDDLALASRLSYFLWNSMPDETLISLAARGELHDPSVLRAQVERMLADAKSERFVDDFVDQWLDLKEIDATVPDKKLYPEFNAYLRDSMLGETRSFFRELLCRDLSVLNVVDSDFAMLNQRMAEHYGLSGVEGSKFREVKLPPGCHRGGVLTQAAVLKVTANGTTTTPVKRGVWVMREIIGRPPDPPPPNVPAVEPDVSGATTIREQLSRHRSDQVCASCHANIDPPGFALENFDVIGGWRTEYRAITDGEPRKLPDGRNVRYAIGPPVDATGALKDGREFSDIDQLKRLLLTDQDQIVRNVIEQLSIYATGSRIGFADRQTVDEILAQARLRNFGLRSILHEIVQSRLFLEK